jgi:hypothetical protein
LRCPRDRKVYLSVTLHEKHFGAVESAAHYHAHTCRALRLVGSSEQFALLTSSVGTKELTEVIIVCAAES